MHLRLVQSNDCSYSITGIERKPLSADQPVIYWLRCVMLQFLANELIFEILRHFLPGLKLSVDQPDLFPWYLGQICSTWRTVFISSPQFWSTLNIDVDAFLQKWLLLYRDSLCELVQVALKRSNGHPLSLNVNMYQVFEADDAILRMHANDILEMLVAHSMHWRDLCMILHPTCYPTLYRAKDRLPILRSIKTTPRLHAHQIASKGSNNYQDIFTTATHLTRVFFTVMVYWRVNWSTVTVIHLVNLFSFDHDEVIPILRQTSMLEELVIVIFQEPMNPSASPVHLPFLKVLYLPDLITLSLFHAPGLEELCVRQAQWRVVPDTNLRHMELLKTTLSGYFRTVHNLRKLAIYPIDTGHALLILEEAPSSTRELALYGDYISKRLTFAASCPQLHNLKAISIETHSHEIQYLLATVKAWAQERQSTTEGGIGPFKNLAQFSLDLVPDKNGDITKAVQHLKGVLEEQGIKFVSQIIEESEIGTNDVPPFDLL